MCQGKLPKKKVRDITAIGYSRVIGAAQTLCIGTKTRMYPPHHTMWYIFRVEQVRLSMNASFHGGLYLVVFG